MVDDDPSIRNSLEKVLEDKYTVRTCADGIEAVRAVNEDTHCVILDVRMPTYDGFWVCKHLRKRASDVPIIFYSAYQNLKDPLEVINEFHPFGYVVKGDTLTTLLRQVANAVKHSKRLRESRRTVEQLRQAREQAREVGGQLKKRSSSPPAKGPSNTKE